MSPLYPLVGTIGLLGRAVQDREQPSRRLPSLQFQRDPLEEIDALIGTTRPSRRMSLDTLLDLPEPRVDGARTPTPATPQPRAPRPTTPTAPSPRAQAPAAPAFDPYEQIRRALEPDPEPTTGPAPNARDIELPASGVPRTIGEVGRTTPSAYGRMADQLPDVSPTVLPTQPERFTTGRDPNIRPAAAEPLPFDDRPRMFGRQIPTVDFAPTLLPAKTVEEAAGMTPFKEGLRPVRPGETAEPPDRPTVVRDWVISGLKGLATVPEAAIGVADLALMGAAAAQPGTSTMPGGVVGRAADAVGFQPAEFKQYLDRFYTKEQQEAQRSVDEADGILETAVATLRNPRVIASTIIESLPLMAAGGVVGRTLAGAGTAPWLAGAIGEGSVAMGSAAEGIRQESGGVITPGQAALAGASGAGTALFGALGGKLAQRLGLPDVDTMLAAAAKDPVAARNVVAVTIGSAITEGFFEELPQSIQEQVLQNFATGKDPWDGVDQAAVLGFLSGAAMGGAVGAAHGARNIGRGGIDAQLTQAANAEQQVSKLLELRQNWQIERQARTGGRPGDQQLMAEADAVLAQIDRQLAALGYRRGTETQEPPLVQDPAAQTPVAARPGVEQPSGPGIPSPVPPPVDQSGAPASLAPQVVAELESRGFTPQEIAGLSAEQAEGIIAADIRKTEQLGPNAVTPPRGTPIPDYVDPRDPPVSDQPTAATGEPTTMSAADTRAAMERVQEARDAARAEREEAANDPIEPIRQALGVAPPPEDNPEAKDAKKDLYGLIRTKQPTSGTELLAANDEYEKARAGGDPAAIPGNEPTPWPRAMSFDAQWGGWKAKTETVLPTPEWLASQGYINRDKVEAIKEKFDDLDGDKPIIVRTAEGQVLILDGHHRLAAAMELEEPVDVRIYQEPAAAAAATDQTVTPEKPVERDRYTPPKPVAEMDDDEFANHILALAQQEQQDKEASAPAPATQPAQPVAEAKVDEKKPPKIKNPRSWNQGFLASLQPFKGSDGRWYHVDRSQPNFDTVYRVEDDDIRKVRGFYPGSGFYSDDIKGVTFEGSYEHTPRGEVYPTTPTREEVEAKRAGEPSFKERLQAAVAEESEESFDDREKRIAQAVKDSKASGARHLDQIPLGVEALRGRRFLSLRDDSEWIARTVDNRGTVYFVSQDGAKNEEISGQELAEFVLQPARLRDLAVAIQANTGKKPGPKALAESAARYGFPIADGTPKKAKAPKAAKPERAEQEPHAYSKDAVRDAFSLTEAQAEAVDVLVQEMGLDTEQILVTKGGLPADGALRQDDFYARAKALYLERGAGNSPVRMAVALRDSGIRLPSRTAADRAAANRLVDRLIQEIERGGAPASASAPPPRARAGAAPSAIPSWPASERYPAPEDYLLALHAAVSSTPHGPRRTRLTAEIARVEAGDYSAPLLLETPDVLYQQPSEQPFYSRLQKAVEDAKQTRATGSQWKGIIRNAKIGQSADEYAFAHVDDLEDAKMYTRDEVLTYLKANEVQVVPVVLGSTGAAAQTAFTLELDDKEDGGEDDGGGWRNGSVTLDDGREFTVGGGWVDADDNFTAYQGHEVGDGLDGLVRALGGDPDNGTDRRAVIETLQEASERAHFGGGSTRGDVSESAFWQGTRGSAQFASYQEPGADEGTYREVFLTAPPTDRGKPKPLTSLPDGYEPTIDQSQPEARRWSVIRPGQAHARPMGTRHATKEAALEEALRIVNSERMRAWFEARDDANWQDGHSQYKDIQNPIVRLRFNVRTADNRRTMFLEEIQPPAPSQPMPDIFRKNWRELGFKWALRYASENGLDAVAWTTGQMQADRYSLEKHVQAIEWEASRSAHSDGTPLKHVDILTRNTDLQPLLLVDEAGQIVQANDASFRGKKLEEVIGKELAKRIIEEPEGTIEEEGLRIGGEGLKRLYDKDLPAVVNKIPAVKRAGVKASITKLPIPSKNLVYEPITRAQAKADIERFGAVAVFIDMDDGPRSVRQVAVDLAQMAVREYPDDLGPMAKAVVRAGVPPAAWVDQHASAENVLSLLEEYGWDLGAKDALLRTVPEVAPAEVPAIEITPELRQAVLGGQPLFQGAKGAVEFSVDGKAVVRGLDGADISTAVHEIAHVARRQLINRNVPKDLRRGITDEDIESAEEWAGAKDGVWTVEAEEKFARGFEAYLREGKAPNSTLTKVFKALSDWLAAIYKKLKGSDIDVGLNVDIRDVFDQLVTRSRRAAGSKPKAASAPESDSPADRFTRLYTAALSEAVAQKPEDYGYGQEGVPRVVEKMRAALSQGSANTNSAALRKVAKDLGVKNNAREWKAFFAQEATAAAPAALKADAPTAKSGVLSIIIAGAPKRGKTPARADRRVDVPMEQVGRFAIHRALDDQSKGIDPKGDWVVAHIKTTARIIGVKNKGLARWIAEQLDALGGEKWDDLKGTDTTSVFTSTERAEIQSLLRRAPELYERAKRGGTAPQPEAPASVPSIIRSGTQGWTTSAPSDAVKGSQIFGGLRMPASVSRDPKVEIGSLGAIPTERGWVGTITAPDGTKVYSETAHELSAEASAAVADLAWREAWPVRSINGRLLDPTKDADEWDSRIKVLVEPGTPASELSDEKLRERAEKAVGELRVRARKELERRASAEQAEPATEPEQSEEPTAAGGIAVEYNRQRSAVQVTFAEKPDEDVRKGLKADGFRWGKGHWYKKATPAQAEKLVPLVRQSLGLTQEASTKADDEPDTWGHAATMSPGAAENWFGGFFDQGLEVRVRHRAHREEGWAYRRGDSSGIVWVKYDHSEAMGVSAQNLEPGWRAGDVVTRGVATDMADDADNGEETPAIDAAVASGLRRQLTHLNNLLRGKLSQEKYDEIAGKIREIEATLMKVDGLPDGYTLVDSGQKNLPSPDAASHFGNKPARGTSDGPALSPKQQAIEDEKAKLKAEAAEIVAQMKAKLTGQVNMGLDPDLARLAVKLIRNYVRQGVLELRGAVARLREDYGEGAAAADRYVELAWRELRGQDLKVADIRRIDVKPAGLSGEAAAVQARAIEALQADPDGFKRRYLERFGRVLNADNASELFDEYAASDETRATQGVAVRAAAGALIDSLYQDLLAMPVEEGREPIVVFTAGGNAAGKSTAIPNEPSADIVFDSTFSSYEPSKVNVDRAFASGRDIRIRYTYRDPMAALQSSLDRALGEAHGRTVTVRGLAATHIGSRDSVLRVADAFRGDPRVQVVVRENTPGGLVARDLNWLREQAYDDRHVLEERLFDALDAARPSLPEAVYVGTRGIGRRRPEDRRGDGRRVQAERTEEPGDSGAPESGAVGAGDGRSERDLPERGDAGAGIAGAPVGGAGDTGLVGLAGEQPVAQEGAPGEPDTGRGGRPAGGRRSTRTRGAAQGGRTGTARGGRVHPPGSVEAAGGSDDVAAAESRGQAPLHFTIHDASDLTEAGWTAKLDANMAALRLLKALQKEARMATADEQKILARYIGWGHTELATIVGPDAGRITDPRKMQARQELEKLLTPAEMRELHESTANAHYSFNDLPRAMWGLVQKLGFKGGTILEPAVGIGHFFGTMPGAILANKRTRLFGVDKEPIASAIAKQLYQGARIQNSPLQDATLPDNYFDLVISNVPFGRIKVFDRNFVSGVKDLLSRSIHNYYFGKAIDVARPGGLIVFVTSRYTMDSRSDTVRKYLSEHADFLGAIRLPDASFKKTAGTEVVTDVIVLRKKGGPEGQAAAPALDWIASQEKEITWKEHDRYLEREYDRRATFEINEYFIKHPKQVLGEQRGDGSMQRTNEPQYNVKGEVTLKHLEKAFDRLKLADNTIVQSKAPDRKIATEKPPDSKQGTFVLEKGQIFLYDNGTLIPSGLKGKSLERAKLYVPVRDAYQKVLDVMVAHGSDEELATAQAALRKTYNAFVKSFGHVSTRENTRIIEMDPNGSRVLALEETAIQKVRQGNRTITQITVTGLAPIMGELKDGKWVVKRTVQPVVEPTSAESPRDALVQSLAWKGAVDLEYMSALTGTPVESLIQSLKGEIFKDPETQAYLSKDEYLSGDVVTKLANAEAAGDEYAENATELKRVQPVPLGPDEFSAPFGSTWVPIELYQQFLNEEGKGQFGVRLTNTEQRTTFYVDGHGRFEFAPAGADVSNWVENALNGKLPTIKSKVPGRGEAVDPALTEQYRQSLSQLREAWDTWWRSNVEAADKLVAIYNGMFNREAARQFDGSHVVIPNASPEIKLRPWQKNVIWRALQAGNTLLAHAVGAGKTYAMIGISGEMKRLGLARKPMIVVPNHLVEQWRRDYLRMYPDAKVLIPTKRDFEKANRQKLLARIANNDWDVVILAATQFLRISVKPETLKAYVDEQVQQLLLDGAEQLNVSTEEFDELVEGYDAGDKHAKAAISGRGVPRTVKDIARQILNLKARLQKRLDQQKKDAPISFEQTGVDALLIDEAHLFKNLFFSTSRNNIAGLRGSDSQRAQDMYLKVRLINEASGGRNVHFATGTPVSNAMSELYTMFRYLAQPALARLGMGGFDAWANAYAVARGEMEPTADGKYKERIRLRDWANLRELSKLFRRFTDVILPEDLIRSGVLKLPKLKGGRPTTIAVEPHPAMQAFMAHIADRVEALKSGKVDPRHDNHLKISSEASLAAIDMRLVNPGAEDYEGSRIRRAAEEIAKRYRASQETLGTQLVFLDVGTPKTVDPLPGLSATSSASAADDVDQDADDDAEGDLVDEQKEAEEAMAFIRGIGADRNLYAELKKLLVQEHGIPADEIAFIHQAKDASDQGRLFQMVRDGKVRVLMASTEKGGTGMNIQDRLVALHHLDVPWRPADMEQREGRILRQGNQNAEVEVLRYVTRGSFDEYRWGLLATKQGFIYQFMRGEISTMDDSDPAQLDMQVAQALASGDPRVLQMLNLEREVKGLRARYTNYERKRGALRQEVAWAERSIELNERRIEKAKPLAEQAEAWGKDPKVEVRVRPGRFGLEVAPAKVFDWEDKDSRKAFNEAIVQVMTAAAERGDRGNMLVAQAGPFQVMLQAVDKQVAEQDESKPTGYGYRKETAHVLSVMVGAIESYGGRYTVPQETAIIIGTTREFDPKHPPDYRRSLDHYLDPDLFSRLIREARATIEARQRDRAEAQASLDKPFKQLEELKAKEEELKAVKLAVGTEKAVAAAGQDDDAPSGGAPSGEASAGMFAEGDEPTTAELRTVRLRPIEFPELVELARTLMNTPQVVKRFRGSMDTLGRFQPGMIRIRGDLFKKGQERQLAATLAHEIGHLVDWLPDYTLKRGNILGRLRTLHGFLKWKYTGKDGVTVHRDEIRGELLALSEKWRPWDKNKASERFRAYRVSSKELYADAISVLLNDPGMLEREAPIFFQEFFSELDAKPDVKAAYFGLQEVLSGTRDELIARRRGGVRGMFEEGDAKAIELERLRRAQKDLEKQDFRIRFKTQFIDKHTPIIERVLETEKASGRRINPDDNPVYWLEERNYMGGRMKAWMEKHIQPVYQALNEARIDWHTFGEALFYDRIIAGDRSEIANPRGLSAANAEELRLAMLEGLSNGQQAVLTKAVSDFRAAIREIADDAYQSGLYTDELYDQMVKNPAYATFQVIEHLDTGVSSRVFKQIGTLKDVTNPADATILKTLVTMRAVEHQRAKVKTFDFLHRHHPADIEQAKEIGSPKGRRPIEPERGDKRRLVTYFEKGKLRGKYVDPYIADSLENLSVGQNNAVIAVLRAINSRVFRPLFTTYNLGFQTFNISRDFWRFWKNQPTMTLARALQRYWEAIPMAKVRAFGLANEDISALRKAARALTGKPTTAPTAKEIQGYKDLIEAEHAQILSITFNDASKGRDVEETQIEDILVRSGVGGFRKPARHPLLRPIVSVLDAIEKAGNLVETLPKAAGIYEFKGKGAIADIPADRRSFIRRKLGSPDFLSGGTYKPYTNEIFLFSNAITQAWRADLEVATQPETRAGFWWKTAALNIVPKLLMFAAAYGLWPGDDDDDLQEIMWKATEYDLTNYIVVPLGTDSRNHAVYLRIPTDDTGRVIGGLLWKLLRAGAGERDVMETAMQVVDYSAGQFPSPAPTLQAIGNTVAFASGRNPYDAFRGRFLFTDDELKARDGRTVRKFLGWEFQQLGGGTVWKFYPGEAAPREQSVGQTIVEAPMVSNIIGRWVRVTSYGEVERLRQVQGEVQRDEARQRLTERDAINAAVREYQDLPSNQQNRGMQRRLSQQIARELYSNNPKERRDREDKIFKKLSLSVVRGKADPMADAIIGATSNDQKVQMILDMKDSMDRTAFERWLLTAVQNKVISPEVRARVRREQRK